MDSNTQLTEWRRRADGPLPPVREVLDGLFRRVPFLILGVCAVTAATGLYLVLPSPYEAEMLFLLKNDRAETVITPEQNSGVMPGASEQELSTEVELLSSHELQREVVVRCNLPRPEGLLRRRSESERLEAAIRNFQKDIQVIPLLKANMIRVKYTSENPQQAAAVLREMAKLYLDKHLQVHGAAGGDFFAGQVSDFGAKLRAAQSALTNFQQRNQVVLLGEQKDLLLRRMLELKGALQSAEVAQAEGEQRVASLEKSMGDQRSRITTQVRQVPNQYSTERLNTMIVELRNRRTELLEKFRPEDRLVTQIDQQIEDTQKALDAARGGSATEEASDVNPLRQSLEGDLIRARAELKTAATRVAMLREQEAGYQRDLNRLESLTADHDELERQVKELEANYLLYSRKSEEARMQEMLDQKKVANVALAEAPVVPGARNAKPLAAVGATWLLGVMLCGVLAVATGRPRQRVYTPSALERLSGVPTLATIPLEKQMVKTGIRLRIGGGSYVG